MSDTILISASEAHQHTADSSALLVCAYESDQKFHNVHLEGAIALSEFQTQLSTIDRDKEIIFYCA
jgi:3-mercaptopyruvate sulfurtransferase SseA